jgi:hypothetical protein
MAMVVVTAVFQVLIVRVVVVVELVVTLVMVVMALVCLQMLHLDRVVEVGAEDILLVAQVQVVLVGIMAAVVAELDLTE